MAVPFIITTQKSNMLDEVTVVYRGNYHVCKD